MKAPRKRKVARARAAKSPSRASIKVKRAYDPPDKSDGMRVLIDRLWPRGLAKSTFKLDIWVKHLAPSNELRRWYQHDPEKFAEFRRRYVAELKGQREGLADLRSAIAGRTVTLLTATKELELSHATVLRKLLTAPRQP